MRPTPVLRGRASNERTPSFAQRRDAGDSSLAPLHPVLLEDQPPQRSRAQIPIHAPHRHAHPTLPICRLPKLIGFGKYIGVLVDRSKRRESRNAIRLMSHTAQRRLGPCQSIASTSVGPLRMASSFPSSSPRLSCVRGNWSGSRFSPDGGIEDWAMSHRIFSSPSLRKPG